MKIDEVVQYIELMEYSGRVYYSEYGTEILGAMGLRIAEKMRERHASLIICHCKDDF